MKLPLNFDLIKILKVTSILKRHKKDIELNIYNYSKLKPLNNFSQFHLKYSESCSWRYILLCIPLKQKT
jgi:hypothetical protein